MSIRNTEASKAIIYIENMPLSPKDIADLRASVGWNRMESEYSNPIMHSYYHIGAYDSDQLVGFIDCVSNGVTDAYIQDLMVSPLHQGNGIGTELMNRMIKHLKEQKIYMISVIFEDKLKSFYRRFGFVEMLSGQMQVYESE